MNTLARNNRGTTYQLWVERPDGSRYLITVFDDEDSAYDKRDVLNSMCGDARYEIVPHPEFGG